MVPILIATHIPVVFADRPGDENADFVGIDNKKESENIISLFSIKPKKVVSLVPIPSNVSTIRARVNGIQASCKKSKVDFSSVELPFEQEKIDKLIKLEIENGGDSFITLNNKCTLPVLSALKKLNIEVPKDVRLISFDDNDSFDYMNPPISALKLPINEIGLKSVERLYERLKESKAPGEHFFLGCDFQARGSH